MHVFSRIYKAIRNRPEAPIQTFTPTTTEELKVLLRGGKVHFMFKKKDGSMRKAYCTTNLKQIHWKHHPQGLREPSPKVLTFFDIEADDWRSMLKNTECFVY